MVLAILNSLSEMGFFIGFAQVSELPLALAAPALFFFFVPMVCAVAGIVGTMTKRSSQVKAVAWVWCVVGVFYILGAIGKQSKPFQSFSAVIAIVMIYIDRATNESIDYRTGEITKTKMYEFTALGWTLLSVGIVVCLITSVIFFHLNSVMLSLCEVLEAGGTGFERKSAKELRNVAGAISDHRVQQSEPPHTDPSSREMVAAPFPTFTREDRATEP